MARGRKHLLQIRLARDEYADLTRRAEAMKLPLTTWARWFLLTGGRVVDNATKAS
jgi:hypothetical protein